MAYACQFTDPGGVVVQSDNVGFVELYTKVCREHQAKEARDRDALYAAGARYAQIRNYWFKPVGKWETASEAELIIVESKHQLSVGDIVGIWDCESRSTRYLSLWTVTKAERFWKTYKLAFKETLCSTAEAASS